MVNYMVIICLQEHHKSLFYVAKVECFGRVLPRFSCIPSCLKAADECDTSGTEGTLKVPKMPRPYTQCQDL